MADSLFDSRYRYDYIYPRGRSGETLRAVDTGANDRPVVIKRPAPNDAPPIRAGQEVSISNERKALARLAGQPALTALLGGGQFYVGGVPHQYIVMERAEGQVVATMISELAAHGERLPELEMLVILDAVLALLSAAHGQDVVYNDVDAKHLFWDRDHYRLKMIDWGNAVFLEGDEMTAQGIGRQSDIFQVGELIYSMLTGGRRPELPRDANEDFRVDFGPDAERIASKLQAIVSRALHPNPRLRYRSIDDLRKELNDVRTPLERERNSVIGRVNERLRRDRSKDELNSLLKTLEPALAQDPGFPDANKTRAEILDRLSDIAVGADLDAARIYLQNGSWSRAVSLLDELRPRSRGDTAMLIGLLLDWARLLEEANLRPAPEPVQEALALAFEGQFARAATLLIQQGGGSDDADRVQWLMSERVSSHVTDVLLLRPNLFRLQVALEALQAEGVPVGEPRALLNEIGVMLENTAAGNDVSLSMLRDRYRAMVDSLTALGTLLEGVNASYKLPNRKLPLSSLERALNATMALADNMHVIGKQAASSTRDALAALDSSRNIDPHHPVWERIADLLNRLYQRLSAYQIYVPAADGSDLEGWLQGAPNDLKEFVDRLFDEMLVGMVGDFQTAEKAWSAYTAALIQGNRGSATQALTTMIERMDTISPTLVGWLNQLRTIITGTSYVERHALFGGLGRALADGWEAFDRSRLADAERLGQQAFEIARTDAERFAARRLRDLAEVTRGWTERNGVSDLKRSETVLNVIEKLYTADELNTRNHFGGQMPSRETYLKAMGKGLVELFGRGSTAAVRLLFADYLLHGTLEAHNGTLEDTAFWREAAIRTLGDPASNHIATRTLDEFVVRRRDLNRASELLNQIDGKGALANLDATRRTLDDNSQARSLQPVVQGLREVENALRDWADGEFRAAGIKIENALKGADEVEAQTGLALSNLKAWLNELIAVAADLHTTQRNLYQLVETKPADPPEALQTAHHKLVYLTDQQLGERYSANLRQWRDTYDAFLSNYTDTATRRTARLARFNELFRAMFIDRHPAYPLYRHWYDVTEASPEFPAPPTDEPTPREEGDVNIPAELRGSKYLETPVEKPRRGLSPLLLGGAAVGLVIILGLVFISSRNTPADAITPTAEQTAGAESSSVAVAGTDESTPEASLTPTPGFIMFTPEGGVASFETPTLGPTTLPMFANVTQTSISRALATTAAPPTETPAHTQTDAATVEVLTETPPPTATASETPTVTFTPSPTVPAEGLSGRQDMLGLAAEAAGSAWPLDVFARTSEGDWRLGIGGEGAPDTPVLFAQIPAELLELRFGNNAAARIQSMEVTMTLTTNQPALFAQNEVYFGALLAEANDPASTIGLQTVVNQPGVLSLGLRQGDAAQMLSQRSVSAPVVRIRLERDAVTGVVTVFYNSEQVGQPVLFAGPNDPLLPTLFVRGGGVIVTVTEWTVTLREN